MVWTALIRRAPARRRPLPRLAAGTIVLAALSADPVRGQESAPAEQGPSAVDEATRPGSTSGWLGLEAAPLEGPLVTDRPDFTESPLTVPRGRTQIEAGYTFTYDREDGVRVKDHTFPELLLRVGLADDLELRVGWAGGSLSELHYKEANDVGRRVTINDHQDGATDLYLGFKWHLFEEKALLPEFALIPAINVPTGQRDKTSGDVDPEIKLAWAYTLTEELSLSGNVNLAVPTTERGRRFFQPSASVSLGYALTDWMGAYVEYFGFYPNDRGSDCAHTLNGGFTFLLSDNLQFDIRAGKGLNEEADDLFAGAGLSVRF
jgi:hypothetical protein